MDIQTVLEELCALGAPSGFEGPASQKAAELLRPLVDEVSIDRLGNVIGLRRCGRPGAGRLLLDAHLDEIGLMVTGIEKGFLRFLDIGGVDPRMLPDREVMVLTDPPIPGIVCCPPASGGEADRALPLEELFVDVGMSQEEAQAAIPVGTPMVFREGCAPLGSGFLCGKAMDDRSCFAVLLRTAELLREVPLDVDLYLLGSTGEETFGSGAKTGAFAVEPHWCVAVDVTHGATPDAPKDQTFPLGGGPAIGVGPNMTRWMTERMIRKAKEGGIPHQLEVMTGCTGTNGWHFQVSREGVATSVVSLPLKYMHSPVEVLDTGDLEATARLLAAFAAGLGEEAERPC